jgi:hypothetical protein
MHVKKFRVAVLKKHFIYSQSEKDFHYCPNTLWYRHVVLNKRWFKKKSICCNSTSGSDFSKSYRIYLDPDPTLNTGKANIKRGFFTAFRNIILYRKLLFYAFLPPEYEIEFRTWYFVCVLIWHIEMIDGYVWLVMEDRFLRDFANLPPEFRNPHWFSQQIAVLYGNVSSMYGNHYSCQIILARLHITFFLTRPPLPPPLFLK